MFLLSQLNTFLKKKSSAGVSTPPITPDSVNLSFNERMQAKQDAYEDTQRQWTDAAGNAATRGVIIDSSSFAPAYLDSFYANEAALKKEKASIANAEAKKASTSSSAGFGAFSSYVRKLKKQLKTISGI